MTACFNELPFEVKMTVWSYIDYDYPSDPGTPDISLVPYACVSREWQLVFERLIFRQVVVRSNQVSCFGEYVNARRMALLRTLRFRIIIPKFHLNYPGGKCQWDNEAFTQSIKVLWALLKFIEDSCVNRQALKLRVHLSAQPSDQDLLEFADDVSSDDFRVGEHEEPNEFAKISDCSQFKSMRVPQDLPVIPWVDGLIWSGPDFQGRFREKIHGGALLKLASKFDGLTCFEASLSVGGDLARQFRSDLAWEMSHLSLPGLSELVLSCDFLHRRVANFSSDAFSVGVHRMIQSPNLVKVSLSGPKFHHGAAFTPELFWPQLEEVGQKPFWPCLQSISVLIGSICPDGWPIHTTEHRIHEVESARFKMDRVNPLFMAAARAAQQMPTLLEMKVRVAAHRDMDSKLGEMAFAAQDYCSEEDVEGEHAALRLAGFIYSDSAELVLPSSQVDLSKPRVSIVMPSRSPVDSRLAQVWKTSKGENVDYKVCYGFVPDDEDDNHYINDQQWLHGDINRLVPYYIMK